jgi:hypothetical protein
MILTEIELHPETIKNLQVLSKIAGSRVTASQRQRLVRVTNKLAELALDAYRSKVPIDTRELRDEQIKILSHARGTNFYASVGIVETVHVGRGQAHPAPLLADMLNAGVGEKGQLLHRTRSSDAGSLSARFSSIPAGESTRGWITSARRAYGQVRRAFLNNA